MTLPNRRPCITSDVEGFSITIGFNPKDNFKPCEVFITARAKSGTKLEEWQYLAGVEASKIMQGEDVEETKPGSPVIKETQAKSDPRQARNETPVREAADLEANARQSRSIPVDTFEEERPCDVG